MLWLTDDHPHHRLATASRAMLTFISGNGDTDGFIFITADAVQSRNGWRQHLLKRGYAVCDGFHVFVPSTA